MEIDWDHLGEEKRGLQLVLTSSERSKPCLLDLCDVIRRAGHATRIDRLRARTQSLPISHAIVVILIVTAAFSRNLCNCNGSFERWIRSIIIKMFYTRKINKQTHRKKVGMIRRDTNVLYNRVRKLATKKRTINEDIMHWN